jgi:hypothetical protein
MTAHIPLIAVLAAVVLTPAAQAQAQAPPPALQWDRECYTDDQHMNFTGTGFTPGADVDVAFSRLGAPVGTFATRADPGGAIADYVFGTSDEVLAAGEERQQIQATATDRIDPARSVASLFTFTEWAGYSPGRYVPGGKVTVEIYGWAFAEGKVGYFLFRKGNRTVASVKVGRLAGPCGDVVARVKVPRKLRAGAYKLWLSTNRRRPSGLSTWRTGRVVRKKARAAASATRAPMLRSPRAGGRPARG